VSCITAYAGVTPALVYHFFSGTLIFLGGFLNAQRYIRHHHCELTRCVDATVFDHGSRSCDGVRFPERFWPGALDYTIHSHGLWHVCSLLSAYAGYYGNLADLADYAATPCT
jgi:hypothetical protein